MFFFFNDTATTEIYTLSLHDALPISRLAFSDVLTGLANRALFTDRLELALRRTARSGGEVDRKSTRLNSSHANISYAVFCLKKKNLYHSLLLLTTFPHTLHIVLSLSL